MTQQADNVKAEVCGWEGCSESFDTKMQLQSHVNCAHIPRVAAWDDRVNYECRWAACTLASADGSYAEFERRQLVERHVVRSHINNGTVVCACGHTVQKWSRANAVKHVESCLIAIANGYTVDNSRDDYFRDKNPRRSKRW